ncbi:MAG: hypothetical protein ACLQPV_03110 [Vulcanimicrobiaceae bacterium]
MSRVRARLVLAATILLGTAGAGIAYANAPSLVATSADALLPSESPALLGPIDAEGRIGWKCRPEMAAAATAVSAAGLPAAR